MYGCLNVVFSVGMSVFTQFAFLEVCVFCFPHTHSHTLKATFYLRRGHAALVFSRRTLSLVMFLDVPLVFPQARADFEEGSLILECFST